jgi:hypothetical protein
VQVIQRAQAPKRDNENKAKWAVVDETLRLISAAEAGKHEDEVKPLAFCNVLAFLLNHITPCASTPASRRQRPPGPHRPGHPGPRHRLRAQQGSGRAAGA